MGAEHTGSVIIRRNKQMIQFIGIIYEDQNVEFYPKAKKPTSSSISPSYTLSNCTEELSKQPQPQEQ